MEPNKIETVIRELFADQRARYGVKVTSVALDYSEIHVEFTFLAGEWYCCSEPGCHLPWDCKKLIMIASARDLHIPDNATVYWHGIVQNGAKLNVLKGLGLPSESGACEWDAILNQSGLKIL